MHTSTQYVEAVVLTRRPYIEREWCLQILADPLHREVQSDWTHSVLGQGPRIRYPDVPGGDPQRRRDGTQCLSRPRLCCSEKCPGDFFQNLHSDPNTDSLDIDLNANPRADAKEIVDGMVVDFDAEGHPVGIDVQNASRLLDLSTLETQALPARNVKLR